ncbi:hypothetical protein ACA910_001793 [Epithemia clementina (nom. ined.)]
MTKDLDAQKISSRTTTTRRSLVLAAFFSFSLIQLLAAPRQLWNGPFPSDSCSDAHYRSQAVATTKNASANTATRPMVDRPSTELDNPPEVEFPYRLTCPGQVLNKANYSVVLGYHIGFMNNWKTVVQDQLHTLKECGLGAALDHFFISYSPSPKGEDATQNDLDDLKRLMQKWSAANSSTIDDENAKRTRTNTDEPTFIPSTGLPWEGAAMNRLRQHCQEKQNKLTNTKTTTVVFYWHTKGTSHWSKRWRQKMKKPWTYSRFLYWRKYMEYFLQERPSYCIDQIVNKGAMTCGVNHLMPGGLYGGNFWAASCDYLTQLPVLTIQPLPQKGTDLRSASTGYFDAELMFGHYQNQSTPWLYVSLHDVKPVRPGLSNRLYRPFEYSHAIENWGPNV